ncbi:NUDIX hydrolase [Marinisporobacter balticus]|uniref:NUDIX domain-containing protein n=1 Tax=Marinisporobacter balticus TaxID=2018667 RepID=A0A4R2K6X6_9FIRM|nr:CoA pyrophosphatase [Marinisporobacter balticus]TCO68294.1 NUDIX domain-containing protein [Marinisporobacter balticus]
MDLNSIQTKIKNRKAIPEGKYTCFSVLVPIVKVKDQLQLLFEVRSEDLKTQPNEICFPGGKLEKNESTKQCAIRETCEELNISPDHIEIMGPLDFLVLPYNLILYPFLGTISGMNTSDILFNRDEVSNIFTVPIDFFIKNKPTKYYIDLNASMPNNFPFSMIPSGKSYHWRTGEYPVLFYQYKNYVIWGLTARIIKNFVNIMDDMES